MGVAVFGMLQNLLARSDQICRRLVLRCGDAGECESDPTQKENAPGHATTGSRLGPKRESCHGVCMTHSTATRLAATLGFLAVALGAFGAHLFQTRLIALDTVKPWGTASLYHLVHAAVLFFLSREYPARKLAWWAFFLGAIVFSGSLYTLSLTGWKWLGAITPLGGVGFLLGWASLIFGKTERT